MDLLTKPPGVDLRARLVHAADEVTALAPVLDRAVAVYREALTYVVGLPGDDAAFAEAFERHAASSGVGALGAALVDLEIRIGAGLWAP